MLIDAATRKTHLRLKVSVVVAQEIAQRTISGLRESAVDAEKMAMPTFLPRLLAARKHVLGVEPQLHGVLMKTLGKHCWSRAMLGRCKASLQRDAKMQALGLALRDEPGSRRRCILRRERGLVAGAGAGQLDRSRLPHQA